MIHKNFTVFCTTIELANLYKFLFVPTTKNIFYLSLAIFHINGCQIFYVHKLSKEKKNHPIEISRFIS